MAQKCKNCGAAYKRGKSECQYCDASTGTKKVVINRRWGGFGLSPKAVIMLKDCGHVKTYEPSSYYGPDWKIPFEYDKKRAKEQGDSSYLTIHEEKILSDEHHGDSRSCPHLVRVVDQLGSEANGLYAELKIVEVPAGVEIEIDDYDGMETVREAGRSWS